MSLLAVPSESILEELLTFVNLVASHVQVVGRCQTQFKIVNYRVWLVCYIILHGTEFLLLHACYPNHQPGKLHPCVLVKKQRLMLCSSG